MEYKKHLPKLSPELEAKRLRELYSLEILDTPPNEQLNNIVKLASQICGVPISLVSLVDNNRQWFKAREGLGAEETPREVAFCAHAIMGEELFIVNDARADIRFADNPLVLDDPNVIFYAGAPLDMGDGTNVGTLCVIDHEPRELSEQQQNQLKLLADQVVFLLKHHKREIINEKISKILAKLHRLHVKEFSKVEDIIQEYLNAGMELLNLEFAISSRIEETDYIIESCISPNNELQIGAVFELPGTYCSRVVELEKSVTYEEVGSIPEMLGHPVYQNMKLESYIGTPIWVNGRIYGTVNFSSRAIRKRKFSSAEVQFVEILADLIGKRIGEFADYQRFRFAFKIFDKSPDFIGIADAKTGKSMFHNKAFEEAVGKKGSDEIPIAEFHPDWATDIVVSKGLPEAMEKGVWSGETALLRPDGSETPVLQTIVVHKDLYNDVQYVSTIMQDITRQKSLESKLVEAKETALETAKIKSEFLATVSHEIRTPMNGILGMVSLLHSTKLSAEQEDMLRTIDTCGQDLINILNDVLDLSKMESKKLNIENIPFDLQKTMEDLSFLFIPRAKERGNSLALNMDPSLNHYFIGDPLRLKQIVGNFVSNAIKFTENGKVDIIVKSEFINSQEQIKISVKDNGTGIKKENQIKIFEAFSQEDSSTTRMYGGTGLGLSIASNLAHLMDAKIDLESEFGKGSCFSITIKLPRADEKSVLETQEQENNNIKGSRQDLPASTNQDTKILLVEDNPINQKLVLAFLNKLGYKADTATNGAEAIEQVNHTSYDIILMDVQMPIMDGVSATKNIRGMEIDQPHIVALTANILPEDVQKYIDAGMDSHLGKPVSKDELAQVISSFGKKQKEKAS